MRSSMMGFEVQKRSLQVAQKSLDITANNLSNIKTPGYTRQRVDTASLSLSSFSPWQSKISKLSLAGQGVTAFGVSQIRNDYLDKRYRDMVPLVKEYDTRVKIMQELETALDNIDNFGLLEAFHNLKSAMQKVSLERADAPEMLLQVRTQAVNICATLRAYNTELTKMLEANLEELNFSLSQTNTLLRKIAIYNAAITKEYIDDAGRIARGEGVSEYGPLELIDQRNLLLDELAEYANIEVFANSNGSVRVIMAGMTVVDDKEFEQIVSKRYNDFGAAVLVFSNGAQFLPKSGELKAYLDLLNGHGTYAVGAYQSTEFGIPYYLHALDAFAEGFAELMNEVNKGFLSNHLAWDRNLIWGGSYEYVYDRHGKPLLDVDGVPVRRMEFEYVYDANGHAVRDINGDFVVRRDENGNPITYPVRTKVTAANIRISDEWANNPLMIGETYGIMLDNNGQPQLDADGNPVYGWRVNNLDGSNLHRFVAALEGERRWGRSFDFYGSAFGYLEFLSDRLGQGIEYTNSMLEKNLDIVHSILDNRDAISAVSNDEEGVNMLIYQKWYNASARIMTTMDEALDTVINRMGRVGL